MKHFDESGLMHLTWFRVHPALLLSQCLGLAVLCRHLPAIWMELWLSGLFAPLVLVMIGRSLSSRFAPRSLMIATVMILLSVAVVFFWHHKLATVAIFPFALASGWATFRPSPSLEPEPLGI